MTKFDILVERAKALGWDTKKTDLKWLGCTDAGHS
jgi:hypothetical protein